MTKTLKIWTEYVKPGCLKYKLGMELLAFIFGLFAKIWFFLSNFKFEQNWPDQKVSDQYENDIFLKSSSRRTFFAP
jgi:hypothetical protein